jgi:hypothetical protein
MWNWLEPMMIGLSVDGELKFGRVFKTVFIARSC